MRQKKKKKDYIANSQCGGLYSYGKLWKESKQKKLTTQKSETNIHRGH